MPKQKRLSDRQKKFAEEYVIMGSAEQAARAAGYSEKYAKALSYKLLDNIGIQQYIKALTAERDAKKIAQIDEVLAYLTAVMRGETQAEVVVIEGTGEGVSRARHLAKRPDERERLRAAEHLLKRYSAAGMLDEVEDMSAAEADVYGTT